MTKQITGEEQLWLEGSKDQARELLRLIDEEQRRRFEQHQEFAMIVSK
ncbi:MAG: hypothetical protein RSG96_06750 [Clostridia bacterium]